MVAVFFPYLSVKVYNLLDRLDLWDPRDLWDPQDWLELRVLFLDPLDRPERPLPSPQCHLTHLMSAEPLDGLRRMGPGSTGRMTAINSTASGVRMASAQSGVAAPLVGTAVVSMLKPQSEREGGWIQLHAHTLIHEGELRRGTGTPEPDPVCPWGIFCSTSRLCFHGHRNTLDGVSTYRIHSNRHTP